MTATAVPSRPLADAGLGVNGTAMQPGSSDVAAAADKDGGAAAAAATATATTATTTTAPSSPGQILRGKVLVDGVDGVDAVDGSAQSHIVRRKLSGYVGFANFPNQWHRKSVKKGFSFNLMVIGESGLGKSTLVNTLFNADLFAAKEFKSPLPGDTLASKNVTVQNTSAEFEENGVKLHLNVIEAPGFGDQINNEESWRPVLQNIESRFDAYLEAENRQHRKNIVDNRIHACIYFIAPTGHSLRPIDIEYMRRVHTRVNLIPVVAKADTFSDEDVQAFKRRVLADLAYHKIKIFETPRYELDDEETILENKEIASRIPFAVVGSCQIIQTPDGRKVRGRRYPWGAIEVDNEDHCDFGKLRQMIIRNNMEELKELTNDMLYENYRALKLLNMGMTQDQSVFKELSPQAKFEEEKVLHAAKLEKMEAEMKNVFQQKVHEKEGKLKQSEEELYNRHAEMKENLEKQRRELEDRKAKLEIGRGTETKRKGLSFGR